MHRSAGRRLAHARHHGNQRRGQIRVLETGEIDLLFTVADGGDRDVLDQPEDPNGNAACLSQNMLADLG